MKRTMVLAGMAILAGVANGAADDYLVRSMARGICNRWLQGGDMAGEVLVHEDFTDAAKSADLWQFYGPTAVTNLPNVGKALEIKPDPVAYSGFSFKQGKAIKIRPGAQYVVNWSTRSPEGGRPLLLGIGGLDANFKPIGGGYQTISQVQVDQPGLFHRNAFLASSKLPEGSVYFQLRFVCTRTENKEARRCYLSEVTVTDISKEVDAMVAALPPTGEYRDKAGERDVLVNVSDNLCDTFPILPDSSVVPGKPGETLVLRECPGERARATAILWTKTARENVTIAFGDMKKVEKVDGGGQRNVSSTNCQLPTTISSAAWSAKVVKCHYQAEGAPDQQQATGGDQVLVPELLVNDDDLVRVDHKKRHTLVKYSYPDGAKHVDVNELPLKSWMYSYPASEMPIADAKTLQPFALPARECKQIVFAVDVPKDAAPGTYRGTIGFAAAEGRIASVPVELTVLPFALPRAETAYSPAQEFKMGLYVWGDLDPDDNAPARICIRWKSREQMLNELKLLVANGVDNPILCWHRESVVLREDLLRRHLDVAREAGLKGSLHLGSSDDVGNPQTPEQLAKLKNDVRRIQTIAREYGFDEVYFYGLDEVTGDKLLSERLAWKAVHEAGGKVIVSGYKDHFNAVGDLLDLLVYADDPESEDPAKWHGLGHKIWKYNSPQGGIEDPNIYRRAYGLYIWKLGYDGASTYCWINEATWNDLAMWQRNKAAGRNVYTYRSLSLGYPTLDGAVETLELVGLGDAIKDVRYMTKFRHLLARNPNAEAEKWYKGLDFKNGDLVKIRRETIDWILKLQDFTVRGKDGAAIQKAIDNAATAGGGRVVVPAGVYPTASIRLRGGVELHLAKDARLVGSTNAADYASFPRDICPMTPEQSSKVFLYAWNESGIVISGEGTIDGQGPAFFDRNTVLWGRFWQKPACERPRMVQLINCRNVRFSGVTFKDSPGWFMLLRRCADIVFDGIRVHADPHIINSDGVDFDTCRHVRVRNCDFSTGDDCIAIRAIRLPGETERAITEDVVIEDSSLESACQTVRIGCPSDDEIRDVTIRNIRAKGTHGICMEYPARYLSPNDDGNLDVHDILVENYTGDFTHIPIRLTVEPGIKIRGARDITFRNVTVTGKKPNQFLGNAFSKMENVRFENVTVNGVREKDGPLAIDCTNAAPLQREDGQSWETLKKGKK